MNTILIAGAGQLGSRHLQGVKTSRHELDIWVYDLSEESLKIAEERYNQVELFSFKTVHFISDLNLIPDDIDVVIVATSSKPRATIIRDILNTKRVKNMILEKFLFPRLCEYDEIKELLDKNSVKTWVNCPRRMWQGYELIKSILDTKQPISIFYSGGEWGMCCNTIHYVDIFMYLNEQLDFFVDIKGLIPKVFESKRAGYIELFGQEVFTTSNGSKLTLESSCGIKEETPVTIQNGDITITYDEIKGIISINGERKDVPVHYQSSLSGVLVDDILEKGTCKLSTYITSSEYHKKYLSQILPFVNKIKKMTTDSCPIT